MSLYKKPELLTSKEVAAILKMSLSWLEKNRVSSAAIPFRKVGNRIMYETKDVVNWIKKQPLNQ